MSDYAHWFESLTGFPPYAWQERLASNHTPSTRLIRIPTGLGKSAGSVLAWLYHRIHRGDESWPRRLVLVLPMRTLADQLVKDARRWVSTAEAKVPVHLLMGGVEAERWVEDLDSPAILVGTQDMLLSRALNRGYGSARGLWPMEFGALHSDTLWVFDEVQLMGVALATSTQLQAFRQKLGAAQFKPSFSWWMSATLQSQWFDSIDFRDFRQQEFSTPLSIPEGERQGGVWESRKDLRWLKESLNSRDLAERVLKEHLTICGLESPDLVDGGVDDSADSLKKAGEVEAQFGSQTLVVLNTVKAATDLYNDLLRQFKRAKLPNPPQLRLAHSRFRQHERAAWDFLDRNSEEQLPPGGRILIATQVVEAGVDISASLLITELAPYSSLVQRFGRAGRRAGQEAQIVVVGNLPDDVKKALPYSLEELESAALALERLLHPPQAASDPASHPAGVSLRQLEEAESAWEPEFLQRVYPYRPEQVLRRAEFLDLFDTTPDLSGADLDVSRYIRAGQERDVQVFFREIEGQPRALPKTQPPSQDELCPVPVGELRSFCDKNSVSAYVLDFETGLWSCRKDLVPGMTVLLPAREGGYDPEQGWSPNSKKPVEVVGAGIAAPVASSEAPEALDEPHSGDSPPESPRVVTEPAGASGELDSGALVRASESLADESLSHSDWKTIAFHGAEVAEEVAELSQRLRLPEDLNQILALAGHWHDLGKAHQVFVEAIRKDARPEDLPLALRGDLAKAPKHAWRRPAYPKRPGFRHELASTLALFEFMKRVAPEHPAVEGFEWPEEAGLLQTADGLSFAHPGAASGSTPSLDGGDAAVLEFRSSSSSGSELAAPARTTLVSEPPADPVPLHNSDKASGEEASSAEMNAPSTASSSSPVSDPSSEPIPEHPLAESLRSLSPEEFDLLAYLVCSHHGKVRCTLASTPQDQKSDLASTFGILDSEALPATEIASSSGSFEELPALKLSLELASIGLGSRYGRSWNERVMDLLERHGPFDLAYLEALFRVADWRASRRTTREER